MGILPVKPRTLLRDEVGERLRTAILEREFEPGSKLVESRVAQMLGVSRAPLREAICALVEEGLLIAKPFAGYYVQSLTVRGLEELYTMRRVLETFAFEHLWPQRSEAFKAELERRKAALLDAIESGSKIAAIQKELELHGTVYEFCDNELLMTMWRGLSGRLQLYWALQQDVHGRKGARLDAHDDYVRLAKGDDLEAMRAEIDDHVQRGLVNVLASLKQSKRKAA
ncbi:GntR family transcriptional regulator [Paraburkholderia sediminicola]|uniref:GntR family transcriptional regulator n=1 Tax=Paraburkholderia sediminicola TaxID=458836 RepID=UPI0038BC3E0D